MNDRVLRSSKDIDTYLKDVFSESIHQTMQHRALREKEKQDATASATSGQQEDPSSGGGDDTDLFTGGGDDDEPEPSKTMDDDSESMKKGEVTTKDVIDKLNSIRSGKSFKDSAVSGPMEQYVESLSKAERTALLSFLKAIAQIVTGEVEAQQVKQPDESPSNVDMEKSDAPNKRHIEPNVIVGSRPKEKVKGGSEDTSGPTPITPKRR